MIFYCDLQGNLKAFQNETVYQGSNNVTTIYVVAPFSRPVGLNISFTKPNKLVTSPAIMKWVGTLGNVKIPVSFVNIPEQFTETYNVWAYALPYSITEQNGVVGVSVNAVIADSVDESGQQAYAGNLTTFTGQFTVAYSALPSPPTDIPTEWTQDKVLDLLNNYYNDAIQKIGEMNTLKTDAKDTLVKAINEVFDEIASTNATIGDLSTLTTDEKTTIVGAINEVDTHADANKAEIGTLNALTTDEKATLVGAINEVDNHADNATTLANNAVATANNAVATANGAKTIAEQAKTIATNSVYSVSFEDIQSAVTALNGYDNAYFKVGNSIYLKQKDVPDMWVYAVASEYVEYTYTTDDDFVNALLLGTVQVGYYVLANLESTGDYDVLKNKPIINQDLSADGFAPVENTYYRHTGTTLETYTAGVIYFYNGTAYKAIDGAGGEVPTSLPATGAKITGNLPTSGWATGTMRRYWEGQKQCGYNGYSLITTNIEYANKCYLPTDTIKLKVSTSSFENVKYENYIYIENVTINDETARKYAAYKNSGDVICVTASGKIYGKGYTNGLARYNYLYVTELGFTDESTYIYTISDTAIKANSTVTMYLNSADEVRAYSKADGSVVVEMDAVPTTAIPYTLQVVETSAEGAFEIVNSYLPTIPESPTSLPVTYKKASGELPTSGWSTLDEGWKGITLPASIKWSGITYGGGKYVAVAESSSAGAYSTDGITWTAMSMPASRSWYDVTYGDGKFVAVAFIKGAYSTDGITWTETTLPGTMEWQSVTYGDGKFVAVTSSSQNSAYSTDGINWTTMSMPSRNWRSVTYGDGKFVAVADGSSYSAYSTDGINWTEKSMPASRDWRSVTYGNGKFVAVARATNKGAYSTDGIGWTGMTLPASRSWKSITYGNGKFVAVAINSNKGAYSTDGINWTEMSLPASSEWWSVTYGDGKYVAVAENSTNGAYWKAAADVTYTISDTSITANTSVKMYLTDEGGVKAQSKASGSITVIRDEVPTTAIPYEYEVEETSAEGLFEVINAYIPTKTSELTNDSGFITAEDIPTTTTLYEDSTGAATVTLSETINNGDIVRIKTNNGNVDHYYIGVAWNRVITVTESSTVTDESDVTVGTAININSLRFHIQDTSLILFHYFETNITTTGAVTITNEKANVVIRKVERIHT